MTKHRTRRAAILTVVALIAASLTLHGIVFAAPVEAGCPSYGDPYTAWTPPPDNAIYGTEQARYPGTCDGDHIYKGKVRDELTDGSCVYIQYRTNSGSSWHTQSYDCSEHGRNYTYYDTDSFAQMRLGRKVSGHYVWEHYVNNHGF